MMHPNTTVKSTSDLRGGVGVYATAAIPRGTLVYVKDDLDVEVSPDQYSTLNPLLRQHVDTYSYREATGVRVVSWDLGKFVNHSCQPNTISTGWGPEIAIEDIPMGAEVTDDYGLLNMEESMLCLCGAGVCRGRVQLDDRRKLSNFWDEVVEAALCFALNVEQPLWSLLSDNQRRDLEEYLSGRGTYRPVSLLAYVPGVPVDVTARHG